MHIVGDNAISTKVKTLVKRANLDETEKQEVRDRRQKWLQYFLRKKIRMFSRISYPPSWAFRAIDSPTLIAHDPFTRDFSGAKGSSWLKSEEDKKEVRPVNPPSSSFPHPPPSLTDRLPTIFGQSLDFAALLADTRPRPRIRLRRATCITIYRRSRAIAAVYPWSFMTGRFTFAAWDRSENPRTHPARGINKSSVSIRAVFSALAFGCMVIARKENRHDSYTVCFHRERILRISKIKFHLSSIISAIVREQSLGKPLGKFYFCSIINVIKFWQHLGNSSF